MHAKPPQGEKWAEGERRGRPASQAENQKLGFEEGERARAPQNVNGRQMIMHDKRRDVGKLVKWRPERLEPLPTAGFFCPRSPALSSLD